MLHRSRRKGIHGLVFPPLSLVAAGLAVLILSLLAPAAHPDIQQTPQPGRLLNAGGVDFPVETILEHDSDRHELVLTGVGIRKKFFFRIYAGAHYVDENEEAPENPLQWIIKGKFPKMFIMHFILSVPKKAMVKELRSNLEKNMTPGELEIHSADVERLLDLFSGDSRKGDVVEVSYIPAKGMLIKTGGDLVGSIDNDRLMEAVWSIWFGDTPVSKRLRDDLIKELQL